jgi:uncharacterized protein YegP (UPF0339 family)
MVTGDDGKFIWRIYAEDGSTVAASVGAGFASEDDCMLAMSSLFSAIQNGRFKQKK